MSVCTVRDQEVFISYTALRSAELQHKETLILFKPHLPNVTQKATLYHIEFNLKFEFRNKNGRGEPEIYLLTTD